MLIVCGTYYVEGADAVRRDNSRSSFTLLFALIFQVFSQMVSNRETIRFSYLETVLSAAVAELQRNKEKLETAVNKEDIAMLQVSAILEF